MMTDPIQVTKTYLPPLDDYIGYLKKIWEHNQLTNQGPLVTELEKQLKEYLGVKHFFLVNNGTIALMIAIKALDLHGDVITTPFSYVATISSLVWQNCRPVFVDIDPNGLSLDAAKIEAAITPSTTAILATHVYGHPCEVEAIERIAKKRELQVVYDAAHAFGVRYQERALASYGDVSTLSFHATKLFHTGEGGAVITDNDAVALRIAALRNFGHKDQEQIEGIGINGKCSELNAAMGLAILPKIPDLIAKRKEASQFYEELLANVDGLRRPLRRPNTTYSYAYFPVIFDSEDALLAVRNALNAQDIFPRRYFYPSLNTLNYVEHQSVPISEDIARRVLCLPLNHALEKEIIEKIARIIRQTLCSLK
jgi:dTDP-4-amino-4,6-dideoxygalactose transaminase